MLNKNKKYPKLLLHYIFLNIFFVISPSLTMSVEHTLAMLTPEGMPHQKEIIKAIKKEGFLILNQRTVLLTPEQVSDFFTEKYGQLDFPLLAVSTSASPVVVLCLGRPRAVETLKQLVFCRITIGVGCSF